MVSPPRHPRGQQRDKIYREADLPDSNQRLTKIIHEFVHVTEPPADLSIDDDRDELVPIE